MHRRAFLALIAGSGALAACSTLSDVASSRGTGVIVSYAAPFDQVWAALPELLKELGMRVTKENMAEGVMLAEEGSGFGTGVHTVIFVERIGTRGNCRVEVVSKGTFGVNLSGITDGAKSVHDRLAQRFRRL